MHRRCKLVFPKYANSSEPEMQVGVMRNQYSYLIAFAFSVALWIPRPASAAEFENAIALREVPQPQQRQQGVIGFTTNRSKKGPDQ